MTSKLQCAVVVVISLAACIDDDTVDVVSQEGVNMQGVNMQGVNMQGVNMQGMSLVGFELGGLRVERGELVAESGARGEALVGAQLAARVSNTAGATQAVAFRIAGVAREHAAYDPTATGATYLYTIEQWVSDTSSWQPACAPDEDGARVAIPVAATWNARGDRVESTTMFTFGCTTGVIAKCYRWGYRPWVSGDAAADLRALHQTCTRLARADYCGSGTPHTRDGTAINVWDLIPIQSRGNPPANMRFEGAWGPAGAVCVQHARWLHDRPECPITKSRCNSTHAERGEITGALMFSDTSPNH